MNLRLFTVQVVATKLFPRLGEKLFDKALKKIQDQSFRIRPEWRLEPVGKVPVVSDNLVSYLEEGSISSVPGIRRVLSDSQVELQDGTCVEVDAIIWCTGYKSDFGMIDSKFDPSCYPRRWMDAPGSNGKPLFRLYHNIFSVEKPESLAFIGYVHATTGGFPIFDMTSMAIAQVWAKKSKLPARRKMIAAVDKHHKWLAGHARRSPNVSPGHCDTGVWLRAMDSLAGTGVNEYLGYGWKGWSFWLRERKFCNMMMGGIWSPHIHRVFEGKRRRWEGAREAIVQVNQRAVELRRGKIEHA